MRERRLKAGRAFYWIAAPNDIARGWSIRSRALGQDFRAARALAEELNAELDAWRSGQETGGRPQIGTVDWMFTRYQTHDAFRELGQATREGYRRHMGIISDLRMKNGARFGVVDVRRIDPRAADRLYSRLKDWTPADRVGADPDAPSAPRAEPRLRQASYAVAVFRMAWRIVRRMHPDVVPAENPFSGIRQTRPRKAETKTPASREEAYRLAETLRDMGHPGLGAAALICFEFVQRPENVLGGAFAWTDYRPGEAVHIEHWKTGEVADLPLFAFGPGGARIALFPEFEDFMAGVPRLGVPVALWDGRSQRRGKAAAPVAKPYQKRHAHSVVAKARARAGLPETVTLAACRHGGMTELGSAELTEAEIMAVSRHADPRAARLYVKRTESQVANGLRKRLAFRDAGAKVETARKNELK